jgi:hypothetical protein
MGPLARDGDQMTWQAGPTRAAVVHTRSRSKTTMHASLGSHAFEGRYHAFEGRHCMRAFVRAAYFHYAVFSRSPKQPRILILGEKGLLFMRPAERASS